MITVEYLTLPGLQLRLNEIDNEPNDQFTSILSLTFQVVKEEPTAILVTKVEQAPELPEGLAEQVLAGLSADAPEEDVGEAGFDAAMAGDPDYEASDLPSEAEEDESA